MAGHPEGIRQIGDCLRLAVMLGAYVIFFQTTLWTLAGLRITRIVALSFGGTGHAAASTSGILLALASGTAYATYTVIAKRLLSTGAGPVLTSFGDQIGLVRAQAEPIVDASGRGVSVSLTWLAQRHPDADYTVSVQLLGPTGEVVASWCMRPVPVGRIRKVPN